MRALEPWHLLVLLALVGMPALVVVGLVVMLARRKPAAQPPQPPAGWYPDPGGSGKQRWWNGTTWTDGTQ
ncbi:MAG TPA: DUF2510 domain-containing protein [Kineosporiaceae bacterium]|nr:DUF2510 domain-containing protein [Kineosporiaceae bacterium]